MFRSQRLNFNQSLLFHNLFNSDQNLGNCSPHKKAKSHLLADLNMTYSRLTQFKRDKVIEPQTSLLNQFPPFQADTQDCLNCKHLKQNLRRAQQFMLDLQRKLIQKQLFLSQKYSQLWDQLEKTKIESCYYQKVVQSTEGRKYEQILIKDIHKLPALEFTKPSMLQFTQAQSSETQKKNLSTIQSTVGFKNVNRKNRNTAKQQTSKINGGSKDQIRQNQDSRLLLKSTGSQLQFSYSSSQRQKQSDRQDKITNNSEKQNKEFGKNRKKTNKLQQKTFDETPKSKLLEESIRKKGFQLSRLLFQNSNLKSYNQVLLEQVKPRNLASKIFNCHKN